MNFKTFLFLILLNLVSDFSFSQDKTLVKNEYISIEKLYEDIDILKNNLESIHAGLYNYTTKDEMDRAFENVKSQIKTPLTSIEFYRRIVSLHRYIKNGHTIIIPSEDFDQTTATTKPILPIDVYWDKEFLYVLRNNSNDRRTIPIGVRIDTINGRNASELFLEMASLWTRDGNNTTFPEGITQRAFAGFYINFIGSPKNYELVYTDDSGNSHKTNIKALTTPEIDKNRLERYGDIRYYWTKDDGDAITLDIKGNIAILRIKTCANSDIRKFGSSIKGILNRFFRKIIDNKIGHLIIDLRDNGGGDEIISRELFRNISQKPFVLFDDSYLITNRIENKKLYKENVAGMNTFAKIGLYKGDDGYYRQNKFGRFVFRSSAKFKEHKPYKKRYSGKIYTLTNAYTFSAAGEMASSMKTNTDSLFIGEEPGGNSAQVVAGETFTLVLPNSKNRVIIPVVNQIIHTTATPRDRGILPDYVIRNSISDMINGRDAVLEYTYKLIRD
ncbi:S41 family peptidase [uncultured Aquimarina sp.]|uniref:S41 family peptidase n=1 Tax=uncultured Aquimarina sp. TaxID=575652 RepID=UPI00261C4D8A|nr:S41 family peptidase [uncultured Aquimarina sp.]